VRQIPPELQADGRVVTSASDIPRRESIIKDVPSSLWNIHEINQFTRVEVGGADLGVGLGVVEKGITATRS